MMITSKIDGIDIATGHQSHTHTTITEISIKCRGSEENEDGMDNIPDTWDE